MGREKHPWSGGSDGTRGIRGGATSSSSLVQRRNSGGECSADSWAEPHIFGAQWAGNFPRAPGGVRPILGPEGAQLEAGESAAGGHIFGQGIFGSLAPMALGAGPQNRPAGGRQPPPDTAAEDPKDGAKENLSEMSFTSQEYFWSPRVLQRSHLITPTPHRHTRAWVVPSSSTM